MKRTKIVTLIAAAVLPIAVAGCGGGSPGGTSGADGSKPQAGGDLVMARAEEPTSLVPTVPTDNAAIWTMEEMYDTLLAPSPDGKSLKPSLATEWKQSDDKLSWTFTLRDGVKFSNGQPMTSADVKFSLAQASKSDAPFSFINSVIASVTTPDDHTVVVKTKKPWSPLPSDMALYANSIVPKDYAGMSQDEFAKKPIGTGPFSFDHWTKGQQIKLVKNPNYWKPGRPYLDSVTFNVVGDSNTRATQVQSGQIQINEGPAYSTIKGLENQSGVKVGKFESSWVSYLTMNNEHKPFDDPNVRKAIAQAVDRQALIKTVLFGNGKPATSYLTPALWAHDDSVKPPAYDLQAAKATLAKSSKPNGFSTTLLISSGDSDSATSAQLIQASLGKIGIKVKIKTLDASASYAARQAGDFDIGFTGCTTDIIDPDEIIRFAGLYDGGSHAVYSFYKNPELDKLADQATKITDQTARKKIYDQIQQKVNQDMPHVPLYYTPGLYTYSDTVHGFKPFPTGNYNLVDVSLSK
ncbi:ABC transporter substrate-binding protein [Microlunatus soli]|uniref:Peptide/nickel transport system substrate-binding protein n=1 Tax=Microlunatus soli TaxID=630515 RepID=A0A1H1UFG7_9ACTN|nr:ABC transporter substrate-binding protein [Microlunatus soli]SDS71274.1 peptide/nickel transport system substrate-binding protein [Microlunatus soli]